MTVAEKMREITNGSHKAQEEKVAKDHSKYVLHLINTKIHKRAKKGMSNFKFKVSRGYLASVVAERFADKGFDVVRASKNGKQYLTVKW